MHVARTSQTVVARLPLALTAMLLAVAMFAAGGTTPAGAQGFVEPAAMLELDPNNAQCERDGVALSTNLPASECQALVAIFETEQTDPDPCNWPGIACDERGEQVHNLNLDFAFLGPVATLPSEVGDLAHLRLLRAANLGLEALPPELGQLQNLEFLSVRGNQLTGLPDALGDLVSLQELILSDNELTALPRSLGSLSLRVLQADGNRISSVSPTLDELADTLVTVVFADNELRSFPALESDTLFLLFLEGNELESPPVVTGLPTLDSLNLRNNRISGDITAFLADWFSQDRDFLDGQIGLGDGLGGNDCFFSTEPSAVGPHLGAEAPDFECDREVGVVRGQVFDPDGGPIFGVQVCAEIPFEADHCVFTNQAGAYELPGLGSRNVRVMATDQIRRYAPVATGWIGVSSGSEIDSVDLRFWESAVGGIDPEPPAPEPPAPEPPVGAHGELRGVVVQANGEPASGLEVCAERVLLAGGACSVIDADGTFQIGVPVGNYRVIALAGDDIVAEASYFGVAPGQIVSAVNLQLLGGIAD